MTDTTTPDPGAPRAAAPARRRVATRVLMTSAAIGAAGSLIIAPITAFSSGGPALALPLIYSALAAVKLLPGALALALLRRPGAALLAMTVVGLVNIPFSSHGPMVFVSLAGVGLLQEIAFALLLYRRWDAWLFYASNLIAAAVIGWLGWRAIATAATSGGMRIGYWIVLAVVAVAVTWIARALAARVARSGVLADLHGR